MRACPAPTSSFVLLLSWGLTACGGGATGAADTDTGDPSEDTDTVCVEAEVPYNGIDDDCDPSTPDDDLDRDGDLVAVDCDDADPNVGPSAGDVGWDGVDQDCDGVDLDARPGTPSLRVDLALPSDLTSVSVAMQDGHALVLGRDADEGDVRGAVVDLANGSLIPITLDVPADVGITHEVVAWSRGAGFGVLVAHESWGEGGACHLFATPVATDGTLGTRRQLTNTATSQARCDLGLAAASIGGADHLFHFQPQRYLAGDDVGNPQIVRRVVDIDTGVEADVDGYGVYQGGYMHMRHVIPFGSDALLAYQFSGGETTKVAVFDASGLADDASSTRIYTGLAELFAPPQAPSNLVSDGAVDAVDGSRSAAMLRTFDDPSDGVPTMEWARVTITPGETNTADVDLGGPDTPLLVGRVPDLGGVGVVIAESGGGYRAVWMDGGTLMSTKTKTDRAVEGDDRLAGQAASLLAVAQGAQGVVYLLDVGDGDDGALHLVTSVR